MLVQKKISRLKKIIYIMIAVIFILASAYLILTNFFPGTLAIFSFVPDIIDEEGAADPALPDIVAFKLEFSDNFLNKSPYINLRPAPILPVGVKTKGRLNPFILVLPPVPTSTKP